MHFAFTSFQSFLHMGKNGMYVWSAYAIVFVVLGFFSGLRRHKNENQSNTQKKNH